MAKKLTTSQIIYYLIGCSIGTFLVLWYSGGISGNDFWWHLKIGEWILENGQVPQTGIFSWYALQENLPWISHEWLSEILLYLVYSAVGPAGILAMSALLALLLLGLLMHTNRAAILEHPAPTAGYLLFSLLIFPVYFYGRPQIFSVFLLFAVGYCLYRFMDGTGRKLIYWIPVLSILWSNLHGGSANLPYTLCLIALVSGLLRFKHPRIAATPLKRREALTLFLVTLASMLATAISPHGLEMIAYPFINMGDALMVNNIGEWASPDAKSLFELLLCFGPILFVSLVLLLSDKKIRLFDLLVFLFFAYLAFRSIRFILLFYIIGSFYVFRYLPDGQKPQPATKGFKFLAACALCVLLAINIYAVGRLQTTLAQGEPIAKVLDDKYISLIQEAKPQKLFNDYNYGELLIYNGIDTFIDGRADLYSGHNLRDAILISDLQAPEGESLDSPLDIEALLDKYGFDAFLVRADRSLSVYLLSHPERYRLIQGDDSTMFFVTVPDTAGKGE